jgi:hypothetical protein
LNVPLIAAPPLIASVSVPITACAIGATAEMKSLRIDMA